MEEFTYNRKCMKKCRYNTCHSRKNPIYEKNIYKNEYPII